jgi:hypothetical protein
LVNTSRLPKKKRIDKHLEGVASEIQRPLRNLRIPEKNQIYAKALLFGLYRSDLCDKPEPKNKMQVYCTPQCCLKINEEE